MSPNGAITPGMSGCLVFGVPDAVRILWPVRVRARLVEPEPSRLQPTDLKVAGDDSATQKGAKGIRAPRQMSTSRASYAGRRG